MKTWDFCKSDFAALSDAIPNGLNNNQISLATHNSVL
jgi:hypothetical protein